MQWAPRAEQIEEIVDLSGGDPRRSSISSRRARRVTPQEMHACWAWRLNGFQLEPIRAHQSP